MSIHLCKRSRVRLSDLSTILLLEVVADWEESLRWRNSSSTKYPMDFGSLMTFHKLFSSSLLKNKIKAFYQADWWHSQYLLSFKMLKNLLQGNCKTTKVRWHQNYLPRNLLRETIVLVEVSWSSKMQGRDFKIYKEKKSIFCNDLSNCRVTRSNFHLNLWQTRE